MPTARVNLLVLRFVDLDRAAAFYGQLGLNFKKHAHGTGPEHYASEDGGFVFELYPATPEQAATTSARIGFAVEDVDAAVAKLSGSAGATIVVVPKDSEWGRRAVVADPEGHRVELVAMTKP
jgi:predicted enzyme related to lactoylglutathione lyase